MNTYIDIISKHYLFNMFPFLLIIAINTKCTFIYELSCVIGWIEEDIQKPQKYHRYSNPGP